MPQARIVAILFVNILVVSACAPRAEAPPATQAPILQSPTPLPPTSTPEPEPTVTPEPEPSPTVQATEAPVEVTPAEEPAGAEESAPLGEFTGLAGVTVIKGALCFEKPGKGQSAVTLAAIELGDKVTVLGHGVSTAWLAIELPETGGINCWVESNTLDLDLAAVSLPFFGRNEVELEEDVEPFDPLEGSQVIEGTLCLAGPASSYAVTRGIVAGDLVKVIGKGVGSGWFVVEIPDTNGVTCWMDWDAVTFEGILSDLKIFAAPPK